MKLKFINDFKFYKGKEKTPFLVFNKGEEIELLCFKEEDPNQFLTKSKFSTISDLSKSNAAYWVRAKNGITIWTSINFLRFYNMLEPVEKTPI